MERFIRHEYDSLPMRMRLIYNGVELTSDTGVPLSQIAIANGLPDPDEVSLSELVEALGRLGVTSISIRIIVKPGRRVRRVKALKPIPN
jgi:enoyl reductase-like protein